YTARLTSALGTTYETVWSVLGDRLFFKTCKEYIASHKSISYNLNNYGATFPAFLRGKFKQFTFLGDLAASEFAFQQLFNTAPVVPSVLNFQSIHPERTQFQFFETASLWSFTHRLYPLWRNRAKIPHGYIPRNFATAEFILMYKRHGEILIELLTENQYKIAKALLKKKSLNRVLNTSKAKPKEVERLFQVLSNGGVVSKIR
ncbi:MAG TPA: putative DNA-binding domain-containing protein, partial [Turneriella sp.]|nr:putative DNA-binding domain-containing protein [Turneriella sp.]